MSSAGDALARRTRRLGRLRKAMVVVHRWVGLVIAAFLTLAGLTGSVIAFYPDLDAMLNPGLYRVAPPSPGHALLDPLELRERIRAQLPQHAVDGAILALQPGKSVNYWINDRETFADPYTGKILGSRKFGDISEGRKNLLTFVYQLHFSLALGDVGTWIFGVVALLWTVDCFVGAYLTFPLRGRGGQGAARKPWLSRWAPAWAIKTNQLFSFVFTWHRANGLWVWGMLLIFAWSAVALNLGQQVYVPVMNAFLPKAAERIELPHLEPPRSAPKIDIHAARERARSLMASEAKRRGFQVLRELWLYYEADHGAYAYTVESTLDIDERLAETTLRFDGDHGGFLTFHAPTGEGFRRSVDSWLVALHFGAVREGGIVYRAFVCLFGVVVTGLSVTGVWIWWRKRSKRTLRRA